MPIQKVGRKTEPLWKEWDRLAQKDGKKETVYAICGDEYIGEWKDNLKHGRYNLYIFSYTCTCDCTCSVAASRPQLSLAHYHTGKGVQTWKKSGSRYDGDWREGKRHGFGMLSVMRDNQQMKEYAGGWKHDKRHVRD